MTILEKYYFFFLKDFTVAADLTKAHYYDSQRFSGCFFRGVDS